MKSLIRLPSFYLALMGLTAFAVYYLHAQSRLDALSSALQEKNATLSQQADTIAQLEAKTAAASCTIPGSEYAAAHGAHLTNGTQTDPAYRQDLSATGAVTPTPSSSEPAPTKREILAAVFGSAYVGNYSDAELEQHALDLLHHHANDESINMESRIDAGFAIQEVSGQPLPPSLSTQLLQSARYADNPDDQVDALEAIEGAVDATMLPLLSELTLHQNETVRLAAVYRLAELRRDPAGQLALQRYAQAYPEQFMQIFINEVAVLQ